MMGRELNRKDNKRKKGTVKEAVIYDNNPMQEVYNLLKIIGIVLGVLIIIYLLVGIFVTKEITFGNKSNKEEITMNSNYLLASETFRQQEEKYYVYFYDFGKQNSNIESAITAKIKDERVYRVDIASSFNDKYIKEKSNINAQNKDDLAINGVTFVLIENGVNVKYIESESAILEFINSK